MVYTDTVDSFQEDSHERLRQLRTAFKATQSRAAELPGVSPRVYTRWENGAVHVHDSLVKRSRVGRVMTEM